MSLSEPAHVDGFPRSLYVFLRDGLSISEEDVKACELKPEILKFLQHVAEVTTDKTAQQVRLTAQINNIAAEYAQESARLKEQLDLMKMSQEGLSATGRANLRILAAAANKLGLASTSPAGMVMAWTQLSMEDCQCKLMEGRLKAQTEQIKRRIEEAQQKAQTLRQVLSAVREQQLSGEQIMRTQQSASSLIEKKEEQYKHQLETYTAKLKALNMRPELTHSSLVTKAEELKKMEGKQAELKKELDGYHNLPASMLGANVLLNDARRDLAAVTQKLEFNLTNLT